MQQTARQDKAVIPTNTAFWYLVVLISAAILYGVTCAPGALWQDSGMYQYRIWNNDIRGGLGLALAHPLYHIIGIGIKNIAVGEFGYRINLVSALFAAAAVANVFTLLRIWLGKNLSAVTGAITLGIGWTFWQHSCIAEVYTLYAALFTAELVFLLLYLEKHRTGYLYLVGLFNGLSIANHMWGIIPLSCYVVFFITVFMRKQIKVKDIFAIALAWLLGTGPYLYLVIESIAKTGDITGTMASALFGYNYADKVFNRSISLRVVVENLLFFGYNFATPNVALFFVGLFGLDKISVHKTFNRIILAELILFFIFAFRYMVPDRYAFFLPFYCLVSIVTGAGAHLLFNRYHRKICVVVVLLLAMLPAPTYMFVPGIAKRLKISIPTKRTIPYRDDYTYFLQPWQCGNNGPELFATEALSSVENEAVIIADGTTVYALWYVQEIKGENRNVKILSKHGNYRNPIDFPTIDTVKEIVAEKPVYVVSPVKGYCPLYILEGYDFVKAGPIYRVVDRSINNR